MIIYQRGYIADLDGTPLDGTLYIGQANQDPETFPADVFWDPGFTLPATQPLSIASGYVIHNGARAAIYVNAAAYSYRARNVALEQVDYVANASESGVSSLISGSSASGLNVAVSGPTGDVTLTTTGTLAVANGGTGGTTQASARSGIGLGSIATFNEGSAADFRANTAGKALSTDKVWDAADEVTLTDAATIAIDFDTFLNAKVTLGGNRTLGTPTNLKNQSGYIRAIQDATGGRTLAYASGWQFVGGVEPVLSTAPNAVDLLFYQVIGGAFTFVGIAKDVKP